CVSILLQLSHSPSSTLFPYTTLFRSMVVARRVDAEATALQRQGELALWPPLLGQEAAQVGSARALRDDDFVFSSYREHAVARVRGAALVDLVRVWRGVAVSGWDPYAINMASPQVIIGAQALHATGWAMGVQLDVDAGRVGAGAGLPVGVAYFGDGAMSQGDVNEALVFRSEEHTSELQSRENLVCRLLLEKKTNARAGWQSAEGGRAT